MPNKRPANEVSLSDLFPENSRLLLTGGGKEFIERIGVEAARKVVLSVMMGENVRTQTEPLTRRRIAQVTGASCRPVCAWQSGSGKFHGRTFRHGSATTCGYGKEQGCGCLARAMAARPDK